MCKEFSSEYPIVCTLTFNSAMRSEEDVFPLRILYGALSCMNSTDILWDAFCTICSELKAISLEESIALIKDIYGSNRRIFIGIDELAKARNSGVIQETYFGSVADRIGILLSKYGEVDVFSICFKSIIC